MRPLLALTLAAALLSPAQAQQVQQVEVTEAPPELRPHEVRDELQRYGDVDADLETRALCAARLGSWLARRGEAVREALTACDLDGTPAALDLVRALQAAPGQTPVDDPLSEAERFLRFTDALDRTGRADALLAAMAPDHPWARAARRALERAPALEELASALDRIGHPDARTATRVRVTYLAETMFGAVTPAERVLTCDGWLLRADGQSVELFDDALQRVVFSSRRVPPEVAAVAGGPLPRIEALDADEECARWLLEPPGAHDEFDGIDTVSYRTALLVRAAWALRRGRPLLAGQLARLAQHDLGEASALHEVLAEARLELVETPWRQTIDALHEGAARRDLLPRLDLVLELLAPLADGRDEVDFYDTPVVLDVQRRAIRLRAHLEQDAVPPAPPSWATWQSWSPEERLACALAHLPEQRGPSARDEVEASTPFPPDAPPGDDRTVLDRLVDLGDLAIPALIELATDPRPTRWVTFVHRDYNDLTWEPVSVGWVALEALSNMLGEYLFERAPYERDLDALALRYQAQTREWLAAWRDRGGLGAWHESRLDRRR